MVKIPGVMDAQVVGVADYLYGEEVAAVIKVKDLKDHPVTKADILNFCKDKIAFFKIPKYVRFVTDYPLTVSGKIQKFILRKEFEEMKQDGRL